MSQEHERFTEPRADRYPTPEEERLADEAARDIDTDRVGEKFHESAQLGVHTRGEGRIDLDPDEAYTGARSADQVPENGG